MSFEKYGSINRFKFIGANTLTATWKEQYESVICPILPPTDIERVILEGQGQVLSAS